jgi:hypothetical protein
MPVLGAPQGKSTPEPVPEAPPAPTASNYLVDIMQHLIRVATGGGKDSPPVTIQPELASELIRLIRCITTHILLEDLFAGKVGFD